MLMLKIVYNTVLDALFPRSQAELESLSYSPAEAWVRLPKAPSTPIPNTYAIFAYKDERVSKLVWNIKYKRSAQAISIGGYALYKQLVGGSGEVSTVEAATSVSRREQSGRRETLRRAEEGETSPGYRSANALPEDVSRPATGNSTLQSFVLIPIPITQKRRNERGYNQCELLLDEIERLDTEKKFMIRKDLIERTQHLSRQALKNRKDRLESAKGIFAMVEGGKNSAENIDRENAIVFVIDDVITTGSTMKEAMSVLENAGFKNVYGLALAH